MEREYSIELITTAPTVIYKVIDINGKEIKIDNPSDMPDHGRISEIREPIVNLNILVPQDYLGAVITYAPQKRHTKKLNLFGRQVNIEYEIPMNEVVVDFFDKLKSISRGYASMEYELVRYDPSDVVKLDVLINGEKVDTLSAIVHRANSVYRGRQLASKLKTLFQGKCLMSLFKLPLVPVSLRGKTLKLYEKMFLLNVTAVM